MKIVESVIMNCDRDSDNRGKILSTNHALSGYEFEVPMLRLQRIRKNRICTAVRRYESEYVTVMAGEFFRPIV